MTIRQATASDIQAVTALALMLWPDHAADALREEMLQTLTSEKELLMLAEMDRRPIAFAHCGLRHDYVEGTNSSPVGYLEGIYVRPEARRSKIASLLVSACETWAKAQGCREFASDCVLENTQSIAFHLGAGFQEAGRLVCFVKEL